MKINKLFPLILITILITGCGTQAVSPDSSATEAVSSEKTSPEEPSAQQQPATPAPAPAKESESLSYEELEEFTALFNTPEYIGFLAEPFNLPQEADWDSIFAQGAGISEEEISDSEIQEYLDATKQRTLYGELAVFRGNAFREFFKNHLNISVNHDVPNSSWAYLEDCDTYYFRHWSSDEQKYLCVSGDKDSSGYNLRFQLETEYHYGRNADRVIRLTKSDNGMVIESNQIMWDDYCVESQTFDIVLSPSYGPVRFITYPAFSSSGVTIILVKDGRQITNIGTYTARGDNNGYMQEVTSVGFFDFNADGVKDIAVIGEADFGEAILLEESISPNCVYEACYGVEEVIQETLDGNYTIEGIRSVLMGNNQEKKYDNYKDAYIQLSKLYNMPNITFTYDLIDTDGDEIPELVIDKLGYYTSLYTFEDGYARCLMYYWPYGAMGNTGYYYAPGKGIFYNHNSDYAGAVQYETYMSKHENNGLEADYCIEYLMFQDTDGDGSPSEEELSATEDYDVYETIYYNYTGREMTDAEIQAQLDIYDSYEITELTGSMDYGTLLSNLCGP